MPITGQLLPGIRQLLTGYNVANSLRFNQPSSDYLNRTPSSAGNQRTFTVSFWYKRTNFGAKDIIMSTTNGGSTFFNFGFIGSGTHADKFQFYWYDGSTDYGYHSARLFRDTSAWYHVVLAVDTTQGTESNRAKVYINGVQETLTATYGAFPQNLDTYFNKNNVHYIGYDHDSSGALLNGYLSEVVNIDGSQLAPDQFGEFDEDSGIWKPIDVSGLTFGTNGFYLDFEESGTGTNASGMGADTSGNTNHFAVNNLTAIDQSTDTCTNNFITLNPLIGTGTYTDNQVYSEGNTIVIPNSTDNYGTAFGTFGATKGKWYWEAQIVWNGTSNNANFPKQIGFMREDYTFNKSYLGQNDDQTWGVAFHDLGTDGWGLDHNGSFSAISGATTMANGGTVMLALDLDNGKFYMGYNGTFFTSGDPTSGATGTGAIATLDATDLSFTIIPAVTNATNSTYYKFNFGNPAYSISSGNTDGDNYGNFEYAVPSGYFSWCTKNLAEYG